MSKFVQMTSDNSHSQHIRLFRSERLEKLSVVSPIGFAAVWCTALPMVMWAGWETIDPIGALVLLVCGLIGWMLFEYTLHRYLFHWRPRAEILRRIVFVMHGNHHANPNDPMRFLMPPIVSLPTAAALWALCLATLGPSGTWAFLGFILSYVVYDMTHYCCHHRPMESGVALLLKRHHMRHHHAGQDGNYAITVPLLDRLFGSRITPREQLS